ncbi:hypothetical protein D6777_02420 [Candidatus Woesearchaeota archaeon]|nr:MAG: hypothetical protein D6777_02420 [Candidatus Woesearchaeota archaeon]
MADLADEIERLSCLDIRKVDESELYPLFYDFLDEDLFKLETTPDDLSFFLDLGVLNKKELKNYEKARKVFVQGEHNQKISEKKYKKSIECLETVYKKIMHYFLGLENSDLVIGSDNPGLKSVIEKIKDDGRDALYKIMEDFEALVMYEQLREYFNENKRFTRDGVEKFRQNKVSLEAVAKLSKHDFSVEDIIQYEEDLRRLAKIPGARENYFYYFEYNLESSPKMTIDRLREIYDIEMLYRRLKRSKVAGLISKDISAFIKNDDALWDMLLNTLGEKYKAIHVVESMEEIGLVRPDGLVCGYVKQDGSAGNMNVYSDANALWGMLLNALGEKDEAKRVVKSMNRTYLVRRDGLIRKYVKADGSYDDIWELFALKDLYIFFSGNNALWGMLLNAVGEKYEARQVVKSMEKRGLVRDDGLVSGYVEANLFDGSRLVHSYDNALWGMLLNALGEKYEAKRVIHSMEKIGLVRDDGLVSHCVYADGPRLDNNVYSDVNALWGMLLNAVGEKDEARQVVKSMEKLGNLVRSDGLIRKYVKADGSYDDKWDLFGLKDWYLFSSNNALWCMLLNAVAYRGKAVQVVESMKNISNLVRADGLVSLYVIPNGNGFNMDVSSYNNALWGLCLHPEGYKVFTGETE